MPTNQTTAALSCWLRNRRKDRNPGPVSPNRIRCGLAPVSRPPAPPAEAPMRRFNDLTPSIAPSINLCTGSFIGSRKSELKLSNENKPSKQKSTKTSDREKKQKTCGGGGGGVRLLESQQEVIQLPTGSTANHQKGLLLPEKTVSSIPARRSIPRSRAAPRAPAPAALPPAPPGPQPPGPELETSKWSDGCGRKIQTNP